MKSIIIIVLLSVSEIFTQWQPVQLPPGGKGIVKIRFHNGRTGIAAGWGSTIFRTTDSGSNWAKIESPAQSDFNDLFLSSSGFYLCGTNGTLLKSTDNGLNWNALSHPSFKTISCVYFTDSLTGIIAGGDTLYRTTNAGQTWEFVPIRYSIFESIHFVSRDTGYASGNYWPPSGPNSAIFRTTNGGRNWDTVKCLVGEELWDMCFIGTTGYAVGEHTMVFKTTDNGRSWFVPGVPQPFFGEHFVSCTFVSPLKGWVTGNRSGLYYTADGGNSWVKQFNYTSVQGLSNLSSVIALDSLTLFAGGLYYLPLGTALFKTTNGGITFIDEPAETGAKTTISELYPNPAADEISFSVPAEAHGYYTYLVYSVLGEQVHPLTSLNAKEGKKIIKINTGQLAPGVYFLRVTSLSGKAPVQTKKFVLRR